MKYQIFLFIVFIFYIKANAQIIAIPDANFKYKLTHGYPNWNYGYDTSHDGEIDMQEAAAITSLTMSRQNIHDITGVRSFVNLQTLNVANCGIYIFDLHDMVSLKTFNCEYNYNLTTSIDLSGCSNLTAIRCGANPITNINLTGAYSLQTFKADYHALTQIDFTGLTQLKTISINYGNLESINLTDVPNLQTLYAFQNRITSLYLSDRPNLRSVLCDSNRLVNMDLKNNPSLINVECRGNLLENLNLEGSNNISTLECSRNNLSELNIKHLKKITRLNCFSNKIVALDMSNWEDVYLRSVDCSQNKLTSLIINNTTISYLDCGENNFTTLDLSGRSKLITFHCKNTPLTYLNITKQDNSPLLSATNYSDIDLTGNYNLFYICTDSWQVGKYEDYIGHIGLNTKVGENCNIEPLITPNPAKDFVVVNTIENITVVYLYDLQGKLLQELKSDGKTNTFVVDLASYLTGFYILKIKTESGQYNIPQKIVKL